MGNAGLRRLVETQAAEIASVRAENVTLRAETAALRAENTVLRGRLADLEQRVGRNPRNSSMPLSAEGLSKPNRLPRSERKAAGRRPGKQEGSPGSHLAQVEDPDEVVVHSPDLCGNCGGALSGAEVTAVETRQVFELPDLRAFVTEHRIERRRCSCGCETKAAVPAVATAPACYGPGVRALAVYLAIYQHLPYERMAELFSDVLGIAVSVGSLKAMVAEAGGALGLFSSVVRDLLRDAPTVHFDETGARVAAKLAWVHVACSALLTLLSCHERRGRVAMDDMGVIAKMAGIACHDGWKPYRSYDVLHQLCNSHHLRELEGIGVVFDQGWAGEMIALLLDAKDSVERATEAGSDHLDPSTLHSIRVRYATVVAKGWAANPAPEHGKRHGVRRTAANLLKRLDTQRDDVLRFASDFRASFSNNQAERDVRMVKVQQKVSGSWRTPAGAKDYCTIYSYVSTMRKQGQGVLPGLRMLFEGGVWLPSRT